MELVYSLVYSQMNRIVTLTSVRMLTSGPVICKKPFSCPYALAGLHIVTSCDMLVPCLPLVEEEIHGAFNADSTEEE